MKKRYETPELEIVWLGNEDVITTSDLATDPADNDLAFNELFGQGQ